MALLASSTMEHNNCRSHQPVEASFPKSMRITREIEKNPQHLWFLVLSPKSSLDKPDPASTARFVWLPPDIHLDLDLPVDGNHFFQLNQSAIGLSSYVKLEVNDNYDNDHFPTKP